MPKSQTSINYNSRFRWSSKSEYMIIHAMYAVYQTHHYQNSGIAVGNRLQFLSAFACVLFVSLPVQYMQTVLGQYVQSSSARLRHMSPIAHGIIYSYVMVSFLRLCREASLAGDAILFALNAMQAELPWLHCGPNTQNQCWFDKSCSTPEPCLNENISLASSKYWNETFMKFPSNENEASSTILDLRRLVTVALVWTLVYLNLFIHKGLTNKLILYIFITSLFMRLAILVTLILQSYHGVTGLLYILSTAYKDLLDVHTWSRQMVAMICYFSIGRGGNILLGSFFNPDQATGILTVFSTVFISGIYFVILESFYVSAETIAQYSNLKIPKLIMIGSIHETVDFTLIPGGLGYTKLSHFWVIVYFVSITIHSVCHLILNLRVLEFTLHDAFSHFLQYRNCLLILSCFIHIILSVIFVINSLFLYTSSILNYILDLFEILITFVFVLCVAWVYGVQKICDDVHFILGSQPTKFWKVTWSLSPIIIFISCILYIIDTENLSFLGNKEKVYVIILEFVFISPVLGLGLYEMIMYIRKRNFIGLFQMTDKWGPGNSRERHQRKIFNPRKETKSRRRNETCQHNCLLKSRILSHVLAEEAAWREDYHEGSIQIGSDINVIDRSLEPSDSDINLADLEH